jgi:cytochrome P450
MTHLPSYQFRSTMPSLWDMARRGVADLASVVPDTILCEPAVQLPGPGAPLVIADPALVREVLGDRDGRFERDRFLRRLQRRAWRKGLAAAEGEDWSRQRRAAAPAFTPSAVAQRIAAFAAAAGKSAANWPAGKQVALPGRMTEIIADIVFSVLVDGKGTVDTKAVAADMPAYIRRIASFGIRDLLPLPEAWHDRLSGIGSDPAVLRLRAVARKLALGRSDTKGDMVALLEGVGPIEDNILGLFPAAMETTASAISWTLYTLARCPDWQARVADEARACGDAVTLDQLLLTRRVVNEVLRLYPPAPLLVRSSTAKGELGGFPLNKGQPVSIHIYAMQRHRTLWDAPDAFDPDRFLPERSVNAPGWMPFGAGARMCVAMQFAITEITVIVARLMAELEFSPAGPEPQLTLQVTTSSATGLHVVAKRRR